MQVIATTTFADYKEHRGGSSGMVLSTGDDWMIAQRRDAVTAYLDAFQHCGRTHRQLMADAVTYGGYQVCKARGWHSLVPQPAQTEESKYAGRRFTASGVVNNKPGQN